jgi:hypothetical protein
MLGTLQSIDDHHQEFFARGRISRKGQNRNENRPLYYLFSSGKAVESMGPKSESCDMPNDSLIAAGKFRPDDKSSAPCVCFSGMLKVEDSFDGFTSLETRDMVP